MSKSRIRITRTREYFGTMRKLAVHVDGKKVGHVKNGASVDLNVLPGSHTVRVSMDWTTSPDFQVVVPEGGLVELRSMLKGGVVNAFWRMLMTPDQMYEFEVIPHPCSQ